MDVLDTQRILRGIFADSLQARFDFQAAAAEIDRLRAHYPKEQAHRMKFRPSIFGFRFIGCALLWQAVITANPLLPLKRHATQAPAGRDVNTITIRPELAPRIKIGQPMMVDLADKLQVPSRVEVDEERLVRIGSYVTGRITDLYVTLGESVKAGDPLARITSPELTQAQLAYLRALRGPCWLKKRPSVPTIFLPAT